MRFWGDFESSLETTGGKILGYFYLNTLVSMDCHHLSYLIRLPNPLVQPPLSCGYVYYMKLETLHKTMLNSSNFSRQVKLLHFPVTSFTIHIITERWTLMDGICHPRLPRRDLMHFFPHPHCFSFFVYFLWKLIFPVLDWSTEERLSLGLILFYQDKMVDRLSFIISIFAT